MVVSTFQPSLNAEVTAEQPLDAEGDPVVLVDTGHWREFACGWGAALINITITYPINKIIFRQMLHGIKASSAFGELRHEGVYFLYRGMLPPLCQKTLSLSLMFGVYEEVRRPLHKLGINNYLAKVLGAMAAGTTEAILMPFERIQTLLQDAQYHNKFQNTLHAFKGVGKTYGIREYYRGLVPILCRNGPSNVGFFIIRDEFHARIPKIQNKFYRNLTEFLCGAMIGVFLSTIFYPLNVIKVQMQSQLGGPQQKLIDVVRQIYVERGCKFRYIYKGVQTNCTRAFISWGIMNTAYEYLKTVVY